MPPGWKPPSRRRKPLPRAAKPFGGLDAVGLDVDFELPAPSASLPAPLEVGLPALSGTDLPAPSGMGLPAPSGMGFPAPSGVGLPRARADAADEAYAAHPEVEILTASTSEGGMDFGELDDDPGFAAEDVSSPASAALETAGRGGGEIEGGESSSTAAPAMEGLRLGRIGLERKAFTVGEDLPAVSAGAALPAVSGGARRRAIEEEVVKIGRAHV